MSLLKLIRQTFGISTTPANNFTLDGSYDNGSMKLYRGLANKGTQDIMTIAAGSGKVNFNQGAQSTGEDVMRLKLLGTKNLNGLTSVEFGPTDGTSIPSWAKEIVVSFANVSTNGSDIVQLQLGTSAGYDASNYSGSVESTAGSSAGVAAALGNGFYLHRAGMGAAAATRHGSATLCLLTGNQWVMTQQNGQSDTATMNRSGCSKTLAGVLDRIRINTINGTDVFDLGNISVMVKG